MQIRSRVMVMAAFAAVLMAGCNNQAEEPQPVAEEPVAPAEAPETLAPGTTTNFQQPAEQTPPVE